MRLVLLTAHTPEGEVQHRYVARRLVAEFQDDLAAIIIATGRARPLATKLVRWYRRYSASQLLSRMLLRVARLLSGSDALKDGRYQRILFPAGDDGLMPYREKLVNVISHNGKDCFALLDELRPDVVVVYGTLQISQAVIERCPCIINLHTGLSPYYRGSDTIFWPLHNGEPDKVGATVHRLEKGSDSGPILARGRPEILPSDGEHEIFAKAVVLGAELLCRAIRREFAGIARPIAQHLEEGREYRSIERTLLAEGVMRKRLKTGLTAGGLPQWQEEF